MMKNEIDHLIDDLLSRWYEYRRGYRLARGYSGAGLTCRNYNTPTHWDWRNGAEDERAEKERMRGVDRAVERIPNEPRRWRTAIEFEAMNLHSGAAVWVSPMLPRDRAELEVLRLEARVHLLRQLQREGVVT